MLSLSEEILIDRSWSHFNKELEGRELDTLLTLLETDRQTKINYDLNISIFKSIQLSGKESRKQRLIDKINKARKIAHADPGWLSLLGRSDKEQEIYVSESKDQLSYYNIDKIVGIRESNIDNYFYKNLDKLKPDHKSSKWKWFYWIVIILVLATLVWLTYWKFL